MVALDNPAGRLYFWLDGTRANGRANPQVSALDTWCTVWDLDHGERAQVAEAHRRGLVLMETAVATRELAERSVSPMAAVGLKTLDQVDNCVQYFPLMARVQNKEFFQHLHDDGVLGLEVLANLLSREASEGWIDDTEQLSLLKQTQDLVNVVLEDDDLSTEDKQQIIDALRHVEETLTRAHIVGGREIEHAVDAMVGSLFRVILRRGGAFITHPVTQAVLALANAVSIALGMGADYLAIAQSFNPPTLPTGN